MFKLSAYMKEFYLESKCLKTYHMRTLFVELIVNFCCENEILKTM